MEISFENETVSERADGKPQKGTPSAMKSPIAGSFDTNQNSLDWSIQSPDGRVHHVRNLRLWLKKHKNNLPGTVTQAFAGFMQMKRCILGNTKRNVFQWKGYRLIAFE